MLIRICQAAKEQILKQTTFLSADATVFIYLVLRIPVHVPEVE